MPIWECHINWLILTGKYMSEAQRIDVFLRLRNTSRTSKLNIFSANMI